MRRVSVSPAAVGAVGLLAALQAPPTATQTAAPAAPPAAPSLTVQIGHSAPLTSVDWSPDGRFILTGATDSLAVLWHAETGRELRRLGGDGPPVFCVAFSPDSRLSAICDGFAIQLWDFEANVVQTRVKAFGAENVAFSPDGATLATAGFRPALWDVETGDELRPLEGVGGNESKVNAIAWSTDGSRIVTGGEDGTVRLWDPATGRESGRLVGHEGAIHDLALTPDGSRLVTSSADRTLRTWDVARGLQVDIVEGWDDLGRDLAISPDGGSLLFSYTRIASLRALAGGGPMVSLEGHDHRISDVAFSPDGRRAVTAGQDYVSLVWDLASGEILQRLGSWTSRVRALDVSPDGRSLATAGEDARAWLWSLESGAVERAFEGHRGRATAVAFSPDGTRLATGTDSAFDGTVRLWEVASGAEVGRFSEGGITAQDLVFTPDGGRVLVGDAMTLSARLWELESGAESRRFEARPFPGISRTQDISPDGRFALTTTEDGARLWDLASGAIAGSFDHGALVASFSPDGGRVAVGGTIWDAATGEKLGEIDGRCVDAVAFDARGERIVCVKDETATLHDVGTGAEVARFEGHSYPITGLDFTPEGRFLVTASLDQSVRVWEVASGEERARLIVSRDGTWAVIAPDGRFDTNDLDSVEGLHWILPDDPLTPLPVEIFLREYYEPGLLTRILAGEELPPLPSIADLNRLQPRIEITNITSASAPSPRGGRSNEPAGADETPAVDVTVRVSSTTDPTGQESQAHDLRLFRNGQLVAYHDGPVSGGGLPETTEVTFRNIRLPRNAAGEIRFTAYAFNRDRVKSLNARRSHPAPAGPPIPGRAYLIHLGVNAYQNRKWDLVYSAGDARIFRDVLSEKLRASGRYREVVPVVLVSERAANRRDLAEATATAGALRAVLGRLAGENPGPDLPAAAAALRPAEPDDLVVVTFSGHGTVDGEGDFYLFPYDIGEGDDREITPELLDHAVSSDELSRWMRDVDAGEIVLVVDACHSAAAVEGEGFKAGPLGSRGLGQLAYDKGMRILAASQADAYAIESRLTEGGLLTYALVRDGLEKERADHRPADRAITVGEWLAYGSRRVPELADQIVRGETPRGVPTGTNDRRRVYQEPALFDFSRRPTDRVVATLDR